MQQTAQEMLRREEPPDTRVTVTAKHHNPRLKSRHTALEAEIEKARKLKCSGLPNLLGVDEL